MFWTLSDCSHRLPFSSCVRDALSRSPSTSLGACFPVADYGIHKRAKLKMQQGFSLIELMIAVVIVGILAAVAFPSYQNYLVKSNRAAAQAFMADVESRQKQYLLDARSYAADLATLGMTAPADVSGLYVVTIATSATPPAFEITATPVTGGRQEADGALTLHSDGTKTPADKW